jgi:hypothetical protein
MMHTLTQAALAQFIGTETWYRHWLNRAVLFTEGVKYVADVGAAYWLLDEITIAQRSVPAVALESFQVWRLRVRQDCSATLACGDGNGKNVFLVQIAYTDFPLRELDLYFTDNTILLPSEY